MGVACEASRLHSSTFDVSIDGADAASGWFGINSASLEPGNVVRRFENELVVGPRAGRRPRPAFAIVSRRKRRRDGYLCRLRVYSRPRRRPRRQGPARLEPLKTGDKWALDVRAVTIMDGPHATLTSTSEFFLARRRAASTGGSRRVFCRATAKLHCGSGARGAASAYSKRCAAPGRASS